MKKVTHPDEVLRGTSWLRRGVAKVARALRRVPWIGRIVVDGVELAMEATVPRILSRPIGAIARRVRRWGYRIGIFGDPGHSSLLKAAKHLQAATVAIDTVPILTQDDEETARRLKIAVDLANAAFGSADLRAHGNPSRADYYRGVLRADPNAIQLLVAHLNDGRTVAVGLTVTMNWTREFANAYRRAPGAKLQKEVSQYVLDARSIKKEAATPFVYVQAIVIHRGFRRRGYRYLRAALRALDEQVRSRGAVAPGAPTPRVFAEATTAEGERLLEAFNFDRVLDADGKPVTSVEGHPIFERAVHENDDGTDDDDDPDRYDGLPGDPARRAA